MALNPEKIAKEIAEALKKELKQKLIIMPKFVEKEFPAYKLVEKEVITEKVVPVEKKVPFEIKEPVIKKIPQEVVYEVVKIVEKPKEILVPQLKYYNIETFKPEDIERMKQILEMFPKIMEMLEKIVKFVPKEVAYEVKVPEIKKVPYPVDVPEYKTIVVAKPIFQEVKILHPVIVEQIMTLEEWNALSEKQRGEIGEIVKSHLKIKEKK